MNDIGLLENVSESQLNKQQKNALDIMKRGKNVFLTGQAGTGKSYTLKVFIKHCIERNIKYAITSTTGVSALLVGGVTLHSWAGILLGMEDKETLLERVQKKAYIRWIRTQVLIIDEISMMSPDLLEKLDYIGKKVRRSPKPFGGIQLIFCGDFAQLPPVKSDYCFKNTIWDLLVDTNIYLTENMRQTDPVFQRILNEVRMGEPSQETIEILQSRIGAQIQTADGIIPTKLYSHRATVAKINRDSLMGLITEKNPIRTYTSKDRVKKKGGNLIGSRYEDQYLSRCDKIFQAVKTLELCVGAQVMLLVNRDLKSGLANGSRGVVIGFENDLPVVRFVNGLEVPIDRNTWSMKIAENIIVSRNQIPLMLAWANTIHKSQGATLDCAQIDLGATIFTYGQSYTALSRCKSLDCISIVTFDPNKIACSPYVRDFYQKIITQKELNRDQTHPKVQKEDQTYEGDNSKEIEAEDQTDEGDKEVKEVESEVRDDSEDEGLCPVCYEGDINSIFIPCGHIYCCLQCSYNIDPCPICRSDILMRNKVHMV